MAAKKKKGNALSSMAGSKAADFALNRAVDAEGNPTPTFQKTVLKALDVQRPLVLMNIRRLRRRHPEETPAQLADRLSRQYVLALTGSGAAVGGTAVVPGVGTVAALGLSAAATVGFLEVTALYAQSIAELHGITTEDPQRSQALVMAVLLGEDGRKMLRDFSGQSRGTGPGPVAGAAAVLSGSQGVSEALFQQLKRTFFKRFVVRQGAGMFGRVLPFGVGAVVGGVGNRAMGRSVVKATQHLFGPLPQQLPTELAGELTDLPEGQDAREQAQELVGQELQQDAEDLSEDVRAAREEHRRNREADR